MFASDEGRMLAEMRDDTFQLGTVHDSYRASMTSDKLLIPPDEFEVTHWASQPIEHYRQNSVLTEAGSNYQSLHETGAIQHLPGPLRSLFAP